MTVDSIDISVTGKPVSVPSVQIGSRTVIVTGKWIKIATVMDESLVEGEVVKEPQLFVSELKASKLKADIFGFSQKIPNCRPNHSFPSEWDNAAVATTASFVDWWEKKIPQEARKNARRAAKRGVSVRVSRFDDEFVKGIKAIYDETPLRQGRRFWHFGKDIGTVKAENGTYPDRSEFIGAYFQDELIGFVKLVYVDQTAEIIQILSKNAHSDKRPTNALIAKAVEVCHERGVLYLVYGKYRYGNKINSRLTEFKRRNGFEELRFPRYVIPLTLKGRIALRLGLHRSLVEILSPGFIVFLRKLRSRFVVIASNLAGVRKLEPAGNNRDTIKGSTTPD